MAVLDKLLLLATLGHIVNGKVFITIGIGDLPFLVTLTSRSSDTFCSGVLISENLILTTKHCISSCGEGGISANFGNVKYPPNAHMTRYVTERHVIRHRSNELALLHLYDPVAFEYAVQPITLNNYTETTNLTLTSTYSVYWLDGCKFRLAISEVKVQGLYGETMLLASEPVDELKHFRYVQDVGAPLFRVWTNNCNRTVMQLIGIISKTFTKSRQHTVVYLRIVDSLDWLRQEIQKAWHRDNKLIV